MPANLRPCCPSPCGRIKTRFLQLPPFGICMLLHLVSKTHPRQKIIPSPRRVTSEVLAGDSTFPLWKEWILTFPPGQRLPSLNRGNMFKCGHRTRVSRVWLHVRVNWKPMNIPETRPHLDSEIPHRHQESLACQVLSVFKQVWETRL